jgi:hypothetical protein
MPTVNIFYEREETAAKIKFLLSDLRDYLAHRLSVSDRDLSPHEVSIRMFRSDMTGMLAPIEIEVTTQAWPILVKEKGLICADIVQFLMKKNEVFTHTHVWLKLCELSHSWKE